MAKKPKRPSAKAPAAAAAGTPPLAAAPAQPPGSRIKIGTGDDGKVVVSIEPPAEPLPSVPEAVDRLDAAISSLRPEGPTIAEAAADAARRAMRRGEMPPVEETSPHPGGRPTTRPTGWDPALAESLIEHMGEGRSARSWCAEPDHWSFTQMLRHVEARPEFGAVYARAREAQADALFDDCVDISDNSADDWIETKSGRIFNGEAARRSQVRIDTRLKIAARLRPEKYSERFNHVVDDKRPATPEARQARIAELLALNGAVPVKPAGDETAPE